MEAVRAVSAKQQRVGSRSQQQLRSVGELDLQRLAIADRQAIFAGAAQFQFSYVFQKSLDDSSLGSSGYSFLTGGAATAEADARDPNNLRLDRSLSAFSIPQIAQFSFVYQLPFGSHRKYGANFNGVADALLGGWQVNGIYRLDNGLPVQLGLCGGCGVNLPTYGHQYPDLLSPLRVAGTDNLNQYFANPLAVAKPAPYSDGDAPRVLSNARIPGADNLTASLFKQVPLRFREGAKARSPAGSLQRSESHSIRRARHQCRRCHLRSDYGAG